MKHIEYAVVAEQREIASGIYSLWLETERIAQEANPGQFLSLYSGDDSRMLPRRFHRKEEKFKNGRKRKLVLRRYLTHKTVRRRKSVRQGRKETGMRGRRETGMQDPRETETQDPRENHM